MFRPLVFAFALAMGATHAFAPCPPGQSEMSVEGVRGVFCVTGAPICIANISTGACPPIQEGLPYGSYCGLVATGVYGCKTLDAESIKTFHPPSSAPGTTSVPVTTMPVPTTSVVTTPVPTNPHVPAVTDGSQCARHQYEMSVEGVPGVFCLNDGPICIADRSTGTCPGPQLGLPNGSYCGIVASGVYGCKTNTGASGPSASPAPSTTASPAPSTSPVSSPIDGSQCSNGQYQMSVEGVRGIFCLSKGPICMANTSTGTCPGPQTGLPNGSYCGIVASGVYGCKTNGSSTNAPAVTTSAPVTSAPATSTPVSSSSAPTSSPTSVPSSAPSGTTPVPAAGPAAGGNGHCGPGNYEMSVEGVTGIFCLGQGPICMADRANGTCPGPQTGLPNGSYCGRVASGVFGCKAGVSSATTQPAIVPQDIGNQTPAPIVSSSTPATTALVSSAPGASAPATSAPVVTTTTPTSAPTTLTPVATTAGPSPVVSSTCPNGGTPMSVEGIVPIFCVQEPACVANRGNGNCPGSQAGLEWGSYCDIISRTGVYGCKPFNGTGIHNNAVYPPVRNCSGNAKGSMPVSVVGKATTYCAPQPVCAGSQFGNCPVAQDDLLHDSKCAFVRDGVYGCVQMA